MKKQFILGVFTVFAMLTMQSGCAMMDYEKNPEVKYTPLLNKLHTVVCKDTSSIKYSERMQRQNEETAIRGELTRMTIGMNMSVSDRKLFNQRYQQALVCP